MWKKFLSLTVYVGVVLMCLFLFPEHVDADIIEKGTCGDSINWSLEDKGTLIISGTGKMYDYEFDGLCAPWYSYAYSPGISSVIINEGVTRIGAYAFDSCIDLESITIANSVTEIGEGAFLGCRKLISIQFPEKVFLDEAVFNNCGIKTLYLSDNATISERTFFNCRNLKWIDVSNNNNYYLSENGVLYNKAKTEIIFYPPMKEATTFSIVDSVKKINQWCFSSNIYLQTVDIPDSVTFLGDCAFSGCSALKNIIIPNSVNNNFSCCNLFNGCTSLENVKLSENITVIGAYMFADCIELESIELPDKITCIESGAFAGCSKLKKVVIPKSVNKIEKNEYDDDVFNYCDNLTIYGFSNSYAEIYAKEKGIPFISIGEGETPDDSVIISDAKKYTDIIGALTHSGNDKSGTGTVYLTYDEKDFSDSSYNYNHTIARFSIGLSTMSYSSNDKMEEVLEKLDYQNIESVKDGSPLKAATAPFWICHKKVRLNGQETEFVLVVIRGTYHEEWLDNFDSGTGHTHVGFQRAADNVLKKMSEYITNSKNNIDKNSDLKILVTGHSRGAATANLVGRALDDQTSIGNINYDSKDIFVYTFATPNVTSLTQRKEQKYQNIFNIVNPEDFVTKVLPSGWGYGRYGITFVLPSSTTDVKAEGNYVNYSSYLVNLQEHFKWTRPNDSKGYIPYPKGMGNVSTYVKDVTNTVQTINQYYMMSLCTYVSGVLKESSDSLHNLYKYTLGGICSNNKEYENLGYAMIAKVSFGAFGWIGLRTVEFFIVNHVKDPKFDCAHYPETYLAAMQCLRREQLTGANRKMLKGIVNCPVDVTITDYEGSVVGRTINDQVDENIENGITMTVEGDSKTFYLPKDMEFNIKLTGNDDGAMDYSLCEYDPDTGEIGRVYYQNIPVNTGVSFTQEIVGGETADEVPLKDVAEKIVSPTKVMDDTQIGTLSVDVSVEGIGSANSMTGLTEGDRVTVSAVTDENNEFLGWYDESGRFITKDADYSFSIHENEKFTAKFTNITVATTGVQFDKNNVNMDVDEYLLNNASVIPSNATDKNLYYSSSDDSVVTVDDFGVFHALKTGKALITAKDISGKYTAQCEVTVGKVDEPVNNLPSGEKGTTNNVASKNKINKITLSGISKQIAAGKKIKLTAQAIPVGVPLPKLTWTSSNPKVATVTQTGVVTVKKKTGGKSVTITATTADGSGISASWKIKSMKGIVKKITVSGAKTVKAGKILKLKAKVTATKGANKKLKWTSSNTKYATVTSTGKVKTFKAGKGKKVKITAMSTDGSSKKKAVIIKIK